MLEFIEKNKRLLASYCKVLRILGWILLCMGVVGTVLLVLEASQTGGRVNIEGILGMLKRSNATFITTGLVSLGFAQLVRYLCENGHKMGLLLRYGEKIFYLYAIIVIWEVSVQVWLVATGQMGGNNSLGLRWLMFFMLTLLYKSAKVLILVGLGQFFKQLIAAIEGSKLKTNTAL